MVRFARFGCIYFGHMWELESLDTATHWVIYTCFRCSKTIFGTSTLLPIALTSAS